MVATFVVSTAPGVQSGSGTSVFATQLAVFVRCPIFGAGHATAGGITFFCVELDVTAVTVEVVASGRLDGSVIAEFSGTLVELSAIQTTMPISSISARTQPIAFMTTRVT